MRNNTILEIADNGVIIRRESYDSVKVSEQSSSRKVYNSTKEQVFDMIADAYKDVVVETLNDTDMPSDTVGYRITLEIVPVTDEKKLIPKRKTRKTE